MVGGGVKYLGGRRGGVRRGVGETGEGALWGATTTANTSENLQVTGGGAQFRWWWVRRTCPSR